MGKPVTIRRWTKEALEAASKVPREDVKAIKHMTKPELVHYLSTVWQRGFEKGREAGLEEAKATSDAAAVSEHTTEEAVADGDV